jgi:hypothetical protein
LYDMKMAPLRSHRSLDQIRTITVGFVWHENGTTAFAQVAWSDTNNRCRQRRRNSIKERLAFYWCPPFLLGELFTLLIHPSHVNSFCVTWILT